MCGSWRRGLEWKGERGRGLGRTEEVGVMLHGGAVEGVEHGVACAVGSAGAAVGLASLAVVEALAAEGTLVDLAVVRAGEGEAVVLQLDDGRGRLLAHVVDGVLVAEPVGALDGVVGVPAPVVLRHVAEGGVDASLGRDGVRAGGEQLGDAPAEERAPAAEALRETRSQPRNMARSCNERKLIPRCSSETPEYVLLPPPKLQGRPGSANPNREYSARETQLRTARVEAGCERKRTISARDF